MRPDFVNDVLVQIISNLICQLIYWLASNLLALLKKKHLLHWRTGTLLNELIKLSPLKS